MIRLPLWQTDRQTDRLAGWLVWMDRHRHKTDRQTDCVCVCVCLTHSSLTQSLTHSLTRTHARTHMQTHANARTRKGKKCRIHTCIYIHGYCTRTQSCELPNSRGRTLVLVELNPKACSCAVETYWYKCVLTSRIWKRCGFKKQE